MDIKIADFEGPLDLLLHLIKENKMDIMNIEIEKISEEYISFLNKEEKLNMEIASEYLVMAAELLEIKSKLLLPKPDVIAEEEEDPRSDLVNRLLEYETYKSITQVLKDKEETRKELYTKTPENVNNYLDSNTHITSDITLEDLVEAFKKYLEREQSTHLTTTVTVKEISVTERCHDIKRLLKEKKRVSFYELFPVLNREYVVATFLAILEMAKNKELVLKQDKTFSDIICEVPNE